jgi:myo-inositol catabolism protein IolC
MRERQERQLLRLQDAARKTRHELLVEIIASRDAPGGQRHGFARDAAVLRSGHETGLVEARALRQRGHLGQRGSA